MQRAFFALLVILLMGITVLPTSAQGGSIADIIENRSDLSTLAIFLDAADPSIRNTLAGSGTYTLFAPNNVAFQNLSSLLDIPLQDLLQSPEIVTQIIQYHLIDGAYDRNGVAQLNGQVVPTYLQGAFVGIRLNDEDMITINNVVEIQQSNIRASNGFVHVVNDVLLNRLIAAEIDNVNLESAITPNPFSETDTPAPTATATAETTQNTDIIAVGNLRIAHFVSDADTVDVYINDTILYEDVAFPEVTSFISLQPGTYNVALAPVDTSIGDAIIGPLGITVADGTFITIAATGSTTNDTVDVSLLEQDYSQPSAEMSRFTFYNAIEAAPAIDVQLNEETIITNVLYGEASTVDIETGIFDLEIIDETASIELDSQRVSLWDGSYYFIVLVGTVAEPQLIIKSVRSDEARELRDGLALANGETQVPLGGGDASEQNVVDTISERDDFSILVAALEAADESVINRLGASIQEPVTLLAPTDRAFENLITTLNMTEETFLNNTDLVTDILLYHIIEDEILAADFRAAAGTSIITTLPNNQAFFVTVTDNGTILLNGFVQFEQVDILTSNGVIHVIEDVLLPQSAVREFGL